MTWESSTRMPGRSRVKTMTLVPKTAERSVGGRAAESSSSITRPPLRSRVCPEASCLLRARVRG